MTFQIFCVYDRKANLYLTPLFGRGSVEVVRGFVNYCLETKSQFSMYPDDYVLRKVGEFDDERGIFTTLQAEDVIDARQAITSYGVKSYEVETDCSGVSNFASFSESIEKKD